VRFEGHYHGWLDNVLISQEPGPARIASAGQLPEALDACFVLPWNNSDALEQLIRSHGAEICAVLMEPVMLNAGSILPRDGYLQKAREICSANNVILIFDETITGFRIALGGAAARFGVIPDLAIYGKAMAGGWPASALAGRAEIMGPVGTGDVNHSGTFNGNTMSMAATLAALRILRREDPYEQLEHVGARLMDGLRCLASTLEVPLRVSGLPMAFHASFREDDDVIHDMRGLRGGDPERYRAFVDQLASAGVWVTSRGIWYLSAAHGESDIAATLERSEVALRNV
jgi:glutamate-1-semialdehyde 2,1-aminomutase